MTCTPLGNKEGTEYSQLASGWLFASAHR